VTLLGIAAHKTPTIEKNTLCDTEPVARETSIELFDSFKRQLNAVYVCCCCHLETSSRKIDVTTMISAQFFM